MEHMKVGRPINRELRESIRTMLDRGMSQAAIARALHRAPSTIAHYCRAIGITPKAYGTMTERDGKRLCGKCGAWKTPGAFNSDRHTICQVCYDA
jgi:hypothetical protein